MVDDRLSELDFINETGRKALRHLGNELARGNVVLFAGAGLSFNAPSKDGGVNRMPGWNAIAEILREHLENNIKDKWDVLKVADYYETAFGRNALVDKIIEAVRDDQHVPGRVHRCLAQLNFREIITTNYDTLIERAFRSLYVTPQVVVEGRDLVRRRQPPRIIKMNGCFERHPGNIVVTGDDFLSHTQRDPLIEVFVTKSFVESQVLFVGFSLNDPAFRAINERVLRTLGDDCPLAFSLQFGAASTEMAYWRTRQVQVIDLKSGVPSELAEEERIHRVMQALLDMQRTRLSSVRRPGPYTPRSLVAQNGTCASTAAVLQKTFPGLSEAARTAFLASPALTLLQMILGENAGDLAAGAVRQRIADYLCSATGLVGLDEPPVHGDDEWRELAELVSLIHEATKSEAIVNAPDAALAVLCALFALQYAAVAPAAENDHRVLETASRLTFECLVSFDMAVRCRYFYLLLLLAPLDMLAKLVHNWISAGGERKLFDPDDTHPHVRVEPTPDEYRLPILSFFGVLQERPVFYQRAAESLWSRELIGSADDDLARPRYEATLRYRYLLQVAQGHAREWPGVHLHRERLERVLGSHALQEENETGHASRHSESLQGMLTELARGWLFGSPDKVRYLKRTLHHVKNAQTRHDLDRLALFMTLVATLPVEGEHALAAQASVMEDAWHAGKLDLTALMRYIAVRVGNAEFTRYTTNDHHEKRAVGRYEDGLALLTAWIVDRIGEEGASSTLRQSALDLLTPVLEKWLPHTASEVTRTHLRHVVSAMRAWDAPRMRPIVDAWLRRQLGGMANGTLPLADLDPDGELLADRKHVRQILARARHGRADLRHDVEEWLVRSADRLEVRVVRELAVDLVEAIEADNTTFGWIGRAARICSNTRLKAEVERQPIIRTEKGLARYVVGRLQSLPENAAKMWASKRSACLADLAILAGELEASQRKHLLDTIEPGALTMDGREGASLLAMKMIDTDSGHGDAPRWATCLSHLIVLGATGNGKLGGYVKRLPAGYAQKLETNLLVTLENRIALSDPSIVEMVEKTIASAADMTFPDLESTLCHLLVCEHRPFAIAAAAALVRLGTARPALLTRNGNRILRSSKVIEGRDAMHAFRPSAAFSENLAVLVNSVSPAAGTALLTSTLSVNGRRRTTRRASR